MDRQVNAETLIRVLQEKVNSLSLDNSVLQAQLQEVEQKMEQLQQTVEDLQNEKYSVKEVKQVDGN